MAISIDTISVNPNAPRGADAVNLYSTDQVGGQGLTLGQLMIAVSMRSAAAYEAQSVLKMNHMSGDSDKLTQAAEYMRDIANNVADWSDVKDFCENVLGITAGLPENLSTYNKRMTAITAIKGKVDALTQTQQTDMIDLQTLVNRRDVAYSTSSNMVRTLGRSMTGNASNL